MIKVGLTGSRYSGKDTVAKAFRQIGVPVFEADTVLKFILNFDVDVNKDILENYGKYIFTGPHSTLDAKSIEGEKGFDRLVDFAEFALNSAYERFIKENKESIYTIFHSSILFERGWNESMDYTINVFCPNQERMARAERNAKSVAKRSKIEKLMSAEMDQLVKNSLSDFAIHNYEGAASSFGDCTMQICKIDQRIVDKFLDPRHAFSDFLKNNL